MEPARKNRPEIEPDIRPDLHVVNGGGESTPERGNLQSVNTPASDLAEQERKLGAIQGGGETTPGRGNLAAVRDQEESTDNKFGYNPTSKSAPVTSKFTFKGALKKKGPMGLILGLIFGGIGGLGMLISPGMAVVQLKEILTDDLNDQLAAMDTRTTHVFKAKLNDMSTGACGAISFKCSYKGFSDRQLKKFRAAGIDVELSGEKTPILRHHKVKSLTFKETVGAETRAIKVDNPRELNRLLGDRMVRTSLRKAFNPKFAGFQDKVSTGVFDRFRTHKGDKLGKNTADMDKSVDSAVKGDPIGDPRAQLTNTTDENGDKIAGSDEQNKQVTEQSDRISSDPKPVKGVFSSVASSGVKGVMITGAADTACTVKNTARAVEAAAKIYRSQQLIRFAMVFLSFADSVKAGTATPEQAEYIGDKLTAIDTDEMIVDEQSKVTDKETGKAALRKNPDYGKNAFDSAGYKVAMYNEAPKLSARSMQYTVGGGAMMGTLSEVNDRVNEIIGRSSCKVIQNTGVRIGAVFVGLATGAVTFGGALALSVGASVAIGMALPLFENYLANIVSGTVVSSSTDGVDAGNAVFAGTAALMGAMAMTRGMKPAKKSDLKSYLTLNEKVQNEYIAMETEEAKKTPFDVNNRYSFLGSLTRTLLPIRTASSTSIGASFANVFNIVPIASSSLTTTTKAQNEYNEERFSKCNDTGYNELGIDADIFCNVRYVLSDKELNMDTDQVIDWMAREGFINPEDGSAQDKYADWITECVEREAGWGEQAEENAPTGINCMNSADRGGEAGEFTDEELRYFRVYTMDKSIFEAMDYEPPIGVSAPLAGGSNFRIASFNVLGTSHTDGPGADKPASWDSSDVRIQRSLDVIKSNNLEIIGFQEFEPSQRKFLAKNLPNYEISSHGKESDSIMWNSDRFILVDKGTWQTVYFGGKIDEPWVKLQDKETKQMFYVMNAHDPINRGQGDAETRYRNALAHLKKVNELKAQAPVFLTGDFNSAFSRDNGAGARTDKELTYCVLTAGGMNNAYDLSIPRPEKCPNEPKSDRNYIDHIYLTPEIEVTSFKEVKPGDNSNGSDHPTIFADAVIPAATPESTGSSSPGSDIVGDDYARECGKYTSCTKQCVDFVKFRLLKHGVLKTAIPLGDGKDVTSTLGRLGYKVDRTPAVHSVMSTAATTTPQWGHTAMVSAVLPDGSIVVEEYNFNNPEAYGKRTISASDIKAKNMTFAHTEVDYR